MRVREAQAVKRALIALMRTMEQALAQNVACHYEKRMGPWPDRAMLCISELSRKLGPFNTALPSMLAIDRMVERAHFVHAQCQDPIEKISLEVLARVLARLSREPSCERAYDAIYSAHSAMMRQYDEHLGPRDWMDRFYNQRRKVFLEIAS